MSAGTLPPFPGPSRRLLASSPRSLRGSAAGADPSPLPAAGSSAGLVDSCRVLSAPPNLAPSLPQEPPFESAHAAPNLIGCGGRTRGNEGGVGRARATEGGAGELEAGTGTRGSPGRSWEPGGVATGQAHRSCRDRARSAPSATPEGAGRQGPRGACWESEFPTLREACPEAAARVQASPGARTVSLGVELSRPPQPSLGHSASVLGGIPPH